MKRKWVVGGVIVSVLALGSTTAFASDGSNGIPQQVAKLFNSIAGLQSTDASQQSQIDTLKTEVDKLTTTVQNLESDNASLHTDINQLNLEVAQLQASGGTPFQSSHTITGTMVDASGKPFSFPGFELDPDNGGTPIYTKYIPDAPKTGKFEFDKVPDGTYHIHFYMPDEYQVAVPTHITVSGQNVSGLVIHLAETTYNISATVLDTSGNPLTNSGIALQDQQGNIEGNGLTTDSTGSFTLAGIPNGTYTLLIGPWDSPVVQKTVTVNNGDVNLGTISQSV